MSGIEWRDHAACRTANPETFFPAAEGGPVYEAQVAAAKQVCAGCLVRSQCLAEALVMRIPFGIAGGLTPEERRDLTPARRSAAAGQRARLGSGHDEMAMTGLALLANGRPTRVVARVCGVSELTVNRWAARARRQDGVSA